jgi:N utilization substance protein A
LAIGRGGQNVRLAAKLTGWKINIGGGEVATGEAAKGAPAETEESLENKENKKENKEEEKPAEEEKSEESK